MIHMNLQFFGGRGSSAGKRSGSSNAAESIGTGSAVTTSKAVSEGDRTFKVSELKTEKDRYGDYKRFNDDVGDWSIGVYNSLKPGDVVTITKDIKGEGEKSASFKIGNLTSDLKSRKVKRSGDLTFGSIEDYYAGQPWDNTQLAALVTAQKSKTKSVRVTIKRKKR